MRNLKGWPPVDPANFSQQELDDALVAMRRVLAAEPDLNDFGYGVYWKTPDEKREADFKRDRESIQKPRSLAAFVACRKWLREFDKIQSLNDKGTSYGLKHVAEDEIGYLTNGVFIAAAIAEGFRVKRLRDTPNARLNISSLAWRGRPTFVIRVSTPNA